MLPTLEAERFSTVITDPPYELGFMGKAWDSSGIAFNPETWRAVMRVCKPGAFLLAFGGTRTFHRLTCAIEDAGWEIRDCMMWLYGSGFPKSLDISKAIDKAAGAEPVILSEGKAVKRMIPGADQNTTGSWIKDNGREYVPTITEAATDAARQWSGWGTALKPAWEPIIVAMKPLDGTFAENAQRHGVAGLNIDGGRVAGPKPATTRGADGQNGRYGPINSQGRIEDDGLGRWPANIILDEVAAEMLDEQSGMLTSGKPSGIKAGGKLNCYGEYAGGIPVTGIGDSGGASRFFYTAKASKSDRGHGNTHATVKPQSLIKYLCTLTDTPTHGEILDPFGGSMTTLVAARECGRPALAIDMVEDHCRIGVDRLRQLNLFAQSQTA